VPMSYDPLRSGTDTGLRHGRVPKFQGSRRAGRPWLAGSVLLVAALLVLPGHATGAAAIQDLRTHSEASGFTEFTPYESMMSFLAELQAGSTDMRLGTFAESHAGRSLPYAVFSRPGIVDSSEARVGDRPVLVLAAGVHGGERTLRESVLLLARELATRGTPMNDALEDLVVLVVPQLNPDGFAAEPGPQRGNLRGLDLNRDYMKLEQPEIRGYVREILLEWRPHLFIDGHNGGSFPYNLNYQCPSHPGADLRITALCDDVIFPEIDRAFEAEGYRSWYYQTGTATRWIVGGTDPRIGRNYGGLANMVAILFESPGGQSMEDGVYSGLLGYSTVVEWARENPELLMTTVREAIEETIALGAGPSGDIPIEVTYAPEERRVEYFLGTVVDDEREVILVQSDSLMKRPVTTHSRPRPWAYVVPPQAEGAVQLLRDHAVMVDRLEESSTVMVEAYTLGNFRYEVAYDHQSALRLEVEGVERFEVDLPEGAYIVRMAQPQGRVAAHLLEAETRDGVVYWNRMDAWIPKDDILAYRDGADVDPPVFPIYRIMNPTVLSTRLLE
jgi:dipeptidyl-peptidase 4